jgi:rhomboid protease GluP
VNRKISQLPYATISLSLLVTICWVAVALGSGQSLLADQSSQLLLRYGAVNGQLLGQGEFWRIVSSQFIHVNLFHMLLNVGFIVLIGAYIERRFGSKIMLLVYLIGGSIGQYVSVAAYPDLVSSGASQALCSLAGFAVWNLKTPMKPKFVAAIVILFIALQSLLDFHSSGGIKAGHIAGLLAGLALGLWVRLYKVHRSST